MKFIKKLWRKFKKKFKFLKKIKKPNFSKLILLIVLIYIGRVIEFSMNMMELTYDLTPLAYLLPSIIAVGGTIVNYYYWKSKNENMAKQDKNPDYIQPSIYDELFQAEYDDDKSEGV